MRCEYAGGLCLGLAVSWVVEQEQRAVDAGKMGEEGGREWG